MNVTNSLYTLSAAQQPLAPGGGRSDPEPPLRRLPLAEVAAQDQDASPHGVAKAHHAVSILKSPRPPMKRSAVTVWVCLLTAGVGVPPPGLWAQAIARDRYAVPATLRDGIATGTLSMAQLDAATIGAGTTAILNGVYPGIRSLLIFRHNRLVYEQYFTTNRNGRATAVQGREVLQDLRSVTKTVVGTAVLMAHAQGKIRSLDQPMFDFLPEYAAYAVDGKTQITIRHLLSMTAGLEWNEDVSYLDPANSEYRMNRAPNALAFVLSRTLVAKPGSTFAYCGGCSHVLAEIVRRTTGMPVDRFVATHLFTALGITKFAWAKGADGLPYGFSGLRLRSRDLGKVGLLLQNKGKWSGTQLIPAELVADALAEHAVVSSNDAAGERVGYGYQLWRYSFVENGLREQLVQLSGNGGQIVYLSDAADLVVVITAGNFDRTVAKSSFDFYLDHVYPAVRDRR